MIIGSNRIFCANLSSTNSHATALLKKRELPEGTIIYTNYQTSGRGQKGNTWESEDGKNLLISIILYPFMVKPEEQFIISKVISLGICDFLKRHINNVLIKWPNDIYVNDDKIAGILIENSIIQNEIENVVAGIGLNINQVKFNSHTPNPVSLSLLTGVNYDLDECLAGLAANLDKRYKQLLNDNRSQIDNDYISHLYRFNKWSIFKDVYGTFKGRIVTVTDTGHLQVQTRNGAAREYMFKEVDFI